jgi:hypothetical protein
MCGLVQKKYIPHMFLTAFRAAELRVNVLKDNIEMYIKEISLMTSWNESNLIDI